LEGNQKDVIFRYSLTLAPSGGDSNYPYPIVSSGNFVFVKKDTYIGEQEKEAWYDVMIDSHTGRLVKRCDPKNDNFIEQKDEEGNVISEDKYNICKQENAANEYYKDFRDNTYLTFQIQKGFSAASLDNQQTLSVLMQELEQKQNSDYENVNAILQEAVINVSQRNSYNSFAEKLDVLRPFWGADDNENLDKQLITASIYVDQLYSVMVRFHGVPCDADNLTEDQRGVCANIPTKAQLNDLLIETRAVIRKKGTTDADAVLPLDVMGLTEAAINDLKSDLITALARSKQI
jgi:hypothetical protein